MYPRGKKPDGEKLTPYQQVKRATTLEEVQALVTGNPWLGRKVLEEAGGPPALDHRAEFERIEQLRAEARGRPRRTARRTGLPAPEVQRMTTTDVIHQLDQPLEGEVMPATPASTKHPEPAKGYPEGERRLRAAGFEEVLNLLAEGHSQREVCKQIGVRQGHLNRWIDSMPDGANRVRECRTRAAQAWLDRGLACVTEADSLAELAKAREVAAICRKFASISDPAFSDRVQVDTTIKSEDPASIDAKLRLIMSQVAQAKALEGDK